ncbi:nucleotide exchange factor GrpE [Streptomyces sp. NPDC005133]
MTTQPPPDAPDAAAADLIKLRRRVEALGRKRDEADDRLRKLLAALLPLDDLLADTAMRAEQLGEHRTGRPDPQAVAVAIALREQVDAAHRLLRSELARCDVRPMELTGKAADPVEARVLSVEPHPTAPADTVLRETVTGFRLGLTALRQAEVVLATPGPAPEPAGDPAATDGAVPDRRAQPHRTSRARRRAQGKKMSPLPRKRRSRRHR